MSRLEYAPIDKEDPEELSSGQKDKHGDTQKRLYESFTDGKHYDDEPDTGAKSPGQEVDSQSSGPEVFTPRDYQQMDFESAVNRNLDSYSFIRRIGHFSKTSQGSGGSLTSKDFCFLVLRKIFIVGIFISGGVLSRIVFSNSPHVSKTQATLSSHCAAASNWAGWQSINYVFAL
jgi:hypothetical protein